MKFDGKFSLAIGMSAATKSWKNKTLTWSAFAKRIKTAVRTSETLLEYFAAVKDDRLKIKDVGGYVGGHLRGGRRKPANVVHRQLITLDLDYAHRHVWEDVTMQFDNAALLHSTHSHSEKQPKFRLIMPINREVSADEYVAIARRLAGHLGIEYFDNTGFQPYRLMFWPSVSKDAEYIFEIQDGPWVDADATLDSYVDWRDSSEWPTSESQLDKVKDHAAKQEDPETKRGVVGAFCRAYTMHDVLEKFLQDEYTPTSIDSDRYTYSKGSTSGGLIVYDDKFAYSHHGTDPCSGKLCNAFDLVRIHRFGHLDIDSPTTGHRTKSYKAMERVAMDDRVVKKIIAEERLGEAKYDFAEPISDDGLDMGDTDWASELEVDARGKYLSSAGNLNLIFLKDPFLKPAFKFNTFDNKRYICKTVPWRKVATPEPMKNVDYSGVRNYIESVYQIVGSSKVEDSLAITFEQRSFHPVRDYLREVIWDETPRIETLMVDYFGAVDNVYTREAIVKMLVGAVARVMQPAVKFDLVLTIVGAQGVGKSTFVKKLGGDWFSDSFTTVNGKEAIEQLQGAWLIEIAELAALRKAEVEAIKRFVSSSEDTGRPAYGRTTETFKRQCVFFGTTNNDTFLTDVTGNRRFLPIDVRPAHIKKSVFDDLTQLEVNQIWAEAYQRYKANEPLYLSEEAKEIAGIEQEKHSVSDDRSGIVEIYLNKLLPKNWDALNEYERLMYLTDDDEELKVKGTELREHVCIAEIWCECLGKKKEDMDRWKTRDLNDIMKSLHEWERSKSTRKFPLYGVQKYYSRKLDY